MSRRSPGGAAEMSGRRHTGLVVDDHEGAREVAADVARALGHEVVAVGSQQEAFAQLTARPFCYVLLDREIPVRKGGGARKEIGDVTLTRLCEEYPQTSVLLITSYAEVDHAVAAMKVGAVDFVVKPYKDLGERVKEALSKGCEARHPQGCPLSGRARSKAPKEVRAQGAPTLHFDGTIESKRILVQLNGEPCFLQELHFRVLVKLAQAALRGQGVPLSELAGPARNGHNVISRLRAALAKGGLPRDVIRSDGHGTYRLAIAAESLSVDPQSMQEHFSHLLEGLARAKRKR